MPETDKRLREPPTGQQMSQARDSQANDKTNYERKIEYEEEEN